MARKTATSGALPPELVHLGEGVIVSRTRQEHSCTIRYEVWEPSDILGDHVEIISKSALLYNRPTLTDSDPVIKDTRWFGKAHTLYPRCVGEQERLNFFALRNVRCYETIQKAFPESKKGSFRQGMIFLEAQSPWKPTV